MLSVERTLNLPINRPGSRGSFDLPSLQQWFDGEAGPVVTSAICVVFSGVSLLFTGSVFGIDNHLFHLPIVHGLSGESQFGDDAFIQSLRYYSSGIWLLLAGVDRYLGDSHLLFHVLLYLSRLLFFAGALACASLLGIRSVRQRAVFALVLCFVAVLDGVSLAGHGALFVNSFGHSEVANGTILLAIFFAVRGQIAVAILLAGLTFFINAFMGIWLVLPLSCIAATLLWRGQINAERLAVQLVIGSAGAAVLASPVLLNIISNPDFGIPTSFDYAAYLRGYFGAHFFIDANPVAEVLLLALLAVAGWLSLSRLKSREVELKAALLGMLAVYLAGVILPMLTTSPVILNLHLLRSGLMIHMLAALAMTALAAKWLTSDDAEEATVLGPYLLFFLCIKYLFPAAGLLIAFETRVRRHRAGGRDVMLRAAIVLALALAVLPWRAFKHFELNAVASAAVKQWEAVGEWARHATAPDSVFLIANAVSRPPADLPASETRRKEAISASSSVFEAASHRRIWVDFKRGAAVMWRQSYYALWRPREEAVMRLRSLGETIEFARTAGIGYVAGDCQLFEAERVAAIFRTRDICVSRSDGAPRVN